MVIEWLEFRVEGDVSEYLRVDQAIWTTALAQYPSFVDKEVWLDPADPQRVVLVIRWRSREQWKAIPTPELAAIAARFTQAVGMPHTLVAAQEFQVPSQGSGKALTGG